MAPSGDSKAKGSPSSRPTEVLSKTPKSTDVLSAHSCIAQFQGSESSEDTGSPGLVARFRIDRYLKYAHLFPELASGLAKDFDLPIDTADAQTAALAEETSGGALSSAVAQLKAGDKVRAYRCCRAPFPTKCLVLNCLLLFLKYSVLLRRRPSTVTRGPTFTSHAWHRSGRARVAADPRRNRKRGSRRAIQRRRAVPKASQTSRHGGGGPSSAVPTGNNYFHLLPSTFNFCVFRRSNLPLPSTVWPSVSECVQTVQVNSPTTIHSRRS